MDDDLEAIVPEAATKQHHTDSGIGRSGSTWRFGVLIGLLAVMAASIVVLVALEIPQARYARHTDCLTKVGIREAARGRGVTRTQEQLFAEQKACLGIK